MCRNLESSLADRVNLIACQQITVICGLSQILPRFFVPDSSGGGPATEEEHAELFQDLEVIVKMISGLTRRADEKRK
jgi:hypothetical protein